MSPSRSLALTATAGVLAAVALWVAVTVAVQVGRAHRADTGVVEQSFGRVGVLAGLAVVPVVLLVVAALLRGLSRAHGLLRVLAVLGVVVEVLAAAYALVTTVDRLPSDLDVYATCLLVGGLAATVLALVPAVLLVRGRPVRVG